jgi:hypothetical protein
MPEIAIRPSPSWKQANQKGALFPFDFFEIFRFLALLYYGSTMFMDSMLHWLKL